MTIYASGREFGECVEGMEHGAMVTPQDNELARKIRRVLINEALEPAPTRERWGARVCLSGGLGVVSPGESIWSRLGDRLDAFVARHEIEIVALTAGMEAMNNQIVGLH